MAVKDDREDQVVPEKGTGEDELEQSNESEEAAEVQEPEEAPRATFTKPESNDDSRQGESDELEEDEDQVETAPEAASDSSAERTLNDLAEEEAEASEHDIPSLSSSSLSDQTSDKNTNYFQRNFTRGVSQTITPNRNRSSKIHLVILLLIGLAVIGGTVYLLKNQFPSSAPLPTPTATPQVPPSPSPTPQVIDRSKFKIRVLNGTSTTGLAGSASAKLKELGYQTDNPRNATNSAFERTVVRIKGDVAGLLEQLIRDLAPEFEAVSEAALKDNDSANAEVILGKK